MSNPGQPRSAGAAAPFAEAARLDALRALDILDTPPEEAFDRIAALAADIFRAPIALVSFVDADRQWFKAAVGADFRQTPREHAFCVHTIGGADVFVIEDACADARFRDNPLVVGAPGVRFYAGAPILDENGTKLGALCVLDRVPRSFSADKRRRLAALAECVASELKLRAARTREAAARALAEDALEARRRLVSTLSHEMRTPLNSILGYQRLLRETALSPEQRSYLDQLATSGRALLGYVCQLIESADMRSAGLVVAERPFALAEVVQEALETVEGALEERGSTVAVDMPAPFLEATTDPDILRRALSYVIASVAALGRADDIRLDIAADAARGLLELRTSFVLAKKTAGERVRKPARPASGLRVARRLLAALGGRLVASRAPCGRLAIDMAIPCRLEQPRARAAAPERLKVLVADDVPANLKLLEVYLRRMGHDPILAQDGQEAVDLAMREPVDVVLMDLQMPRLDGVEATRRILAARADDAPRHYRRQRQRLDRRAPALRVERILRFLAEARVASRRRRLSRTRHAPARDGRRGRQRFATGTQVCSMKEGRENPRRDRAGAGGGPSPPARARADIVLYEEPGEILVVLEDEPAESTPPAIELDAIDVEWTEADSPEGEPPYLEARGRGEDMQRDGASFDCAPSLIRTLDEAIRRPACAAARYSRKV
ncbi:GAF domain-containing hybrid sensor histidine kinase/response regulator [Amphiplicatus metriothermophilus]|uniref:histidine kinase n=1 Tax=Amphiplicatus metriothermophilus TaxID=1519374 RepID=A0A239PVZ0_9PROT|nr:GAF domain-containing hybrid sensor histidine kinase/response regulator [Amphiplicatus metriothermophilus]MBB5519552.1 CheY-like chemotaxis protein [Amphiplicatus metriothermophilus]SNT74116.1 Signal transduction histidine kinase [Amphiplicatus metriothermophilus]